MRCINVVVSSPRDPSRKLFAALGEVLSADLPDLRAYEAWDLLQRWDELLEDANSIFGFVTLIVCDRTMVRNVEQRLDELDEKPLVKWWWKGDGDLTPSNPAALAM